MKLLKFSWRWNAKLLIYSVMTSARATPPLSWKTRLDSYFLFFFLHCSKSTSLLTKSIGEMWSVLFFFLISRTLKVRLFARVSFQSECLGSFFLFFLLFESRSLEDVFWFFFSWDSEVMRVKSSHGRVMFFYILMLGQDWSVSE